MNHNVWIRSKTGWVLSGGAWINTYMWSRHSTEETESAADAEAHRVREVSGSKVIVARDGLWPNSQIGEGHVTFVDEANPCFAS